MKIIEISKNQEVEIKTNPDGTQTVEIKDKGSDRLGDLKPGEHFKIADWVFTVLQHDERGTLVISKTYWPKMKSSEKQGIIKSQM